MAVDEPRDEELEDGELHEDSLVGSLHDWLRTQAPWWAVSCTAHMAAPGDVAAAGEDDCAED